MELGEQELPSTGPQDGGPIRRIQRLLPSGGSLPDDVWRRRHRWILALLWLHAPGLAGFGILRGYSIGHVMMEAASVAAFALLAGMPGASRKLRAGMASVGLMTSSAILVHLSGGMIEAHFAFFVMIGVLTLYEDWLPFLLSMGYVVVHHGLVGTIDPQSVYNHAAGWGGPWKWSLIHGVFVTAASLAYVAFWRLNEEARADAKESYLRLREAEERFHGAFENAPIGMHLMDLEGRFIQVNRAFCEMTGYSEAELLGKTYQSITHPEDMESDLQHMRRMTAGEIDHYQIEKRFQHSAGHSVWTMVSRSSVRGPQEELLYLVSQVQDITQRKQSDLMLTHMALHDSLTGLPNRTLALDRLAQALARTERHPSSVAVLFLDLDRFKVINDSLGHTFGDQLLVGVGARLREAVRPSDTVARIGGDEFVVVCEDIAGVEDAILIAGRIADALARPFDLNDDDLFLATSVGIALSSGPGDTPESLLRDADAAMYRAKEGGRNRYEVFDSSMRVQAVERLDMERGLRHALERSELRLFYQPVVEPESGAVVGVEALLRWDHPERGLLRPAEFISLAEDTGLIFPIGRWALQEACRQAQRWRQDNPDRPRLAMGVNISARQLAQPDVAEMVGTILAATAMDPADLWLEITETALTGETEATVTALRALKALGVRLAVDDFGTGYSSLLYLKKFPIDVLKVDQSFVSGLGRSAEDAAIVAGVVGLAQTLGLTTIAEGVETEEQLSALRALGCDFAQGYLFGHPEPPDGFGEVRDAALSTA